MSERPPVPRVAAGFAIVLLLVLATIAVLVRSHYHRNQESIALIDEEISSLVATKDLEVFFNTSLAEFRGFVVTGDQDFWARSLSSFNEFSKMVAIAQNPPIDEKTLAIIEQVREIQARALQIRTKIASLVEAKQSVNEIAETYKETMLSTSGELSAQLERLRENKLALLHEKFQQAHQTSRATFALIIGFSAVCLAFAIFLAAVFTRRSLNIYWQMKQAMDKFRMAVKISDDLIWEWDLQNKKIQLFEGVFSTFQYGNLSDPTLLNTKIHPEDRDRVLDGLNLAINDEDRDLWTDSYRLQRKDRSYADVAGRALITRNENKKAVMVLGAVIDVSELSQAIRARDEMSAVISHELKNPVASIEMTADLLERELAKISISDTARAALTRLHPISHRMNRLLRDLLDITRIESNTIAIEAGTHEPAKVIEEIIFLFRPEAEKKDISLRNIVPAGLPLLLCDRDRVLQILSNLVSNSIKFTPEFGIITIKVTAKQSLVEFEVSDTGSGIAEENLQRVFDRFWRASQKRKDSTGLGLAIAKGLVTAQGGTIWAESELGRGTSFHFTIPASPEGPLTEQNRIELERKAGSSTPLRKNGFHPNAGGARAQPLVGVRILLVDDSQDSLFLIKTLLEVAGAEVIEAESVQSALFVLKTFTPHLLLTDIDMPIKTGIDLLNEIRRSPEFQATPALRTLLAVAMTAHEARSELRKIEDAGFDHIFLKPISSEQIFVSLPNLIQKRKNLKPQALEL
jgi:signal transduction histidine kinase/ActR/RegA family two-component response regulator